MADARLSAVRFPAPGAPALDAYLSRVRARLDAELSGWLPELFRDFSAEQTAAIREACEAGKRLRGALVCLVCEALGGRFEAALPGALAIEGIHCASLIHDDFVDGDEHRRSRPATWTLEGARRAVLLGDLLFASILRASVEADPEAGAIVARAIADLARGAYDERLELDRVHAEAPSGRYTDIISRKTGALFAAGAELGARAARAGPDLRRDARRFGEHLGAAYQIADDAVDLEKLARAAESDAHAAGVSVVLLYEFSDLDEAALGALGERSGRPRDWPPPLLERVQRRMDDAVAAHTGDALAALDAFPESAALARLESLPGAMLALMRREALAH